MSAFAETGVIPIAALEAAINAVLGQDPETLRRLGRLHGKVVAIELCSAPDDALLARVFVLPGAGGLRLLATFAGSPDTVLRGTPLALTRLGLGDSMQAVQSGEVRVTGDLELGQAFKRALAGLHIDWEEGLAQALGDSVAHRTGHAVRSVRAWATSSAQDLRGNVTEYLQEELRLLPGRAELDGWLGAVDVLRDDCARLEARVQRLRARLAGRHQASQQASPPARRD